ncbi:hypothetical protein NDA14_000934 [Ustilago hordei]|nr:hypothetical protein NDA14_000934 [Ustilago hordei]
MMTFLSQVYCTGTCQEANVAKVAVIIARNNDEKPGLVVWEIGRASPATSTDSPSWQSHLTAIGVSAGDWIEIIKHIEHGKNGRYERNQASCNSSVVRRGGR